MDSKAQDIQVIFLQSLLRGIETERKDLETLGREVKARREKLKEVIMTTQNREIKRNLESLQCTLTAILDHDIERLRKNYHTLHRVFKYRLDSLLNERR